MRLLSPLRASRRRPAHAVRRCPNCADACPQMERDTRRVRRALRTLVASLADRQSVVDADFPDGGCRCRHSPRRAGRADSRPLPCEVRDPRRDTTQHQPVRQATDPLGPGISSGIGQGRLAASAWLATPGRAGYRPTGSGWIPRAVRWCRSLEGVMALPATGMMPHAPTGGSRWTRSGRETAAPSSSCGRQVSCATRCSARVTSAPSPSTTGRSPSDVASHG